MPRETKAELAARIAEDNRLAAQIPTGTTKQDPIFGEVVLGPKVGETDGWDLYETTHSGFKHQTTSALIWRAFTADKSA